MTFDLYQLAERFLEKLYVQLSSTGFSFSHYPIDHLCYRVPSQERYEQMKQVFCDFGRLLSEEEINGRPISTYSLHRPIHFRNQAIRLIELPAPKIQKPYVEGFEHAEFIVGIEMGTLTLNYPDLRWDSSAIGNPLNPELRLELSAGLSAKFHPRGLDEVIEEERLLALEKIDWRRPEQLLATHPRRKELLNALEKSRVFTVLADLDPLLTGTFPLGIDLPESDLDILVSGSDLGILAAKIESAFGSAKGFRAETGKSRGNEFVHYSFVCENVPFEIFGTTTPSDQQDAYRHLRIEATLIALAGEWSREALRELKRSGLKTEPAFAKLFGLTGDPYQAVLDLHFARLDSLRRLARAAVYR